MKRELIARSKRLTIVQEELDNAEESLEVVVAQLGFLEEQAFKSHGHIPYSVEYDEVRETISKEIAFLRSVLSAWQGSLVMDVAELSKKDVVALEKAQVLDQADDILHRSEGNGV